MVGSRLWVMGGIKKDGISGSKRRGGGDVGVEGRMKAREQRVAGSVKV